MASTKDLERSCGLIAVLFLTRSKPGPKLVFHYPAKPQLADPCTHDGRSESSSSDLESDEDSEVDGPTGDSHEDSADVELPKSALQDADGHDDNEKVLGYHIDSLEKLLSPGRWSAQKKFEVSLDGITFVGHPVYAKEEAQWSTRHRESSTCKHAADERPTTPTPGRQRTSTEAVEATTTGTANITITAPETPDPAAHDFRHIPESLDSRRGLSFATSMGSTSTTSGAVTEQMTMFHVIFALKPNLQEEIITVYQHVAKKLAKALHYCQKQSNYVALHSRKLLALRAKAKQLKMSPDASLREMIGDSELAWALMEVYERISAGEIAGIRLNGMPLSLQIPTVQPGTNEDDCTLSPHAALLLLEDKEVLLHELSHLDATPLAHFIREHTPTKSLQKHTTSTNMSLSDILYMAQHLLDWRKAKTIPPLHPRNMYTSDSEAPTEKIRDLSPIYGRKFAALPSLPQMLKVLSGKPIQYGLLIPSRDHRAPYMDILAFLVRHRFVVHFKTYGWLNAGPIRDDRPAPGSKSKSKRPISGVSLLSPQKDDDSVSVSSGRTAIAITDAPTSSTIARERAPDQHIILDPSKPTEEECAILEHINQSIVDPELRERFSQLLPHFDGEHSFEGIAAEEGLKRSKVEDWIGMLHRQGHLRTFRSV